MEATWCETAEKELLEQACAGNAEAFSELIQPHWLAIYGISVRILKNHEDAEDNVQSALSKAYRKIRQFHGDSKVSTWLHRIAVNEALMELRRRRAAHLLSISETSANASELAVSEIEDPRPSPERRCIASDLASKALVEFDPALKNIFVLNKTEGWTHSELAKTFGTTDQTIKSRIFRARMQLRQRMRTLSEKPAASCHA
jgi:RNA polymerase sigma-70 factor (ECF subfamily)